MNGNGNLAMDIETWGAPVSPGVPRAGVMVNFRQDGVLVYALEMLYVPGAGDIIRVGGSTYAVIKRTWTLSLDPPHTQYVALDIVLVAITVEQAEQETDDPTEG